MILVGLTGNAGHGKSTVADYLVKEHGFQRLSFAGPLKAMARRINPIIGVDIDLGQIGGVMMGGKVEGGLATIVRLNDAWDALGSELAIKATYPEYRTFLQQLGTDGVRKADDSFWIKQFVLALMDAEAENPDARLVVDDVRFPNEAGLFAAGWSSTAFTHLWRVSRPGYDGGAGTHESEQHVGRMGETRHLKNNGTTQELEGLVDAVIKPILGGIS